MIATAFHEVLSREKSMAMADGLENFPPDYAAARLMFRAACDAAGLSIDTMVNGVGPGPSGETLACDMAWAGPPSAPRVLLCISGTHGFEGPAGSSAQIGWLKSGAAKLLPKDVAVLLVHALNPWGYAWVSRLTENNVDLNRNFIDWPKAPPKNPFYHHVRDLIRVNDMSPATLMALIANFNKLVAEIGPAKAQVAADYGQYEDPEGITYGGNAPEFGHRVIRDAVAPRLQKASHVGLVDLHTGVGAYGEIAYLPLGGRSEANLSRIGKWWGDARVRGWKRSVAEELVENDPSIKDLPNVKSGQLPHELHRFVPKAKLNGATVEFGTAESDDRRELVFITLYERFLRFVDRGNRMDARHAMFRAAALKAFVPQDPAWRAMVVREGPKIIADAVAGLALEG